MADLRREIMRQYARAVMHLREQKKLKRLGLVFGAGVSQDFGFPSWAKLVSRIAADPGVAGEPILAQAASNTCVSQLLFQRYRTRILESLPDGFDEYDRLSSFIQSGWHRVVHDALYHGVPEDPGELSRRDPYIREFLPIIKETRLTINYNFDDTLQTLLGESRSSAERREKRGFRTVWSGNIQLYPQNAVIYHPNGYLPRDFRERPSDGLIFLEDAFGDQLLDSVSGHYAALSYHFSQNTCLFIGLSLDDATLKHLLRKNATLHPGHVQYYVHFLEDSTSLGPEHREAIRDANFEVYNLITLFLDRNGIGALGRLLAAGDDEIELIADEVGVPTAYRFFLTGSVSVGKSTAVSHFRSLLTHDEWLDKKAPGMERDPERVTDPGVIHQIDAWVAKQWRLKNFVLNRATSYGIHIIDRSPLDAFAFTPEDEWVDKAKFTSATIRPDRSQTPLCKGKVILLIGDPEVMAVRAMKLQKDVTPDLLGYRQELLRLVYDRELPGVVELDTRDKSVWHVVREICRMVHLEPYEECDLQARLGQIETAKVSPPEALPAAEEGVEENHV